MHSAALHIKHESDLRRRIKKYADARGAKTKGGILPKAGAAGH